MKEVFESEKSDSDSVRCSGSTSTKRCGEKPKESRNNVKCRVASEVSSTPWNSTHTQKGTRVQIA